jgi:hypothetical protein
MKGPTARATTPTLFVPPCEKLQIRSWQEGWGRLGLEKGRQRFNTILKGHLEIEWMGHFDEMLSGRHPFSKKLRAQFLQVEDQATVPAITPMQVSEFIEELGSYGH